MIAEWRWRWRYLLQIQYHPEGDGLNLTRIYSEMNIVNTVLNMESKSVDKISLLVLFSFLLSLIEQQNTQPEEKQQIKQDCE